ncbi:hypothetical protein ACFFWD_12865 [Bradyrhizobium erythrophlei]|uniref:hypothetical protein n=1 Tax=Bradyrhizobium erythrophlei TaxID=1437360 RepID=UPI0035E639AD
MTKAVQQIILSRSRDIPFNKLMPGQSGVRRVLVDVSIEQPAASIPAYSSLNKDVVIDVEANERGVFYVAPRCRRNRVVGLPVKQKRLATVLRRDPVENVAGQGGM